LDQCKKPTGYRLLMAAVIMLLAVFFVAGCQNAEESAPDAEVAVVDVEPVVEEETAVPTPTTVTEEEPVSTEPEPVDYCLECHIDQEMLIDTAAPQEEVIVENVGEG